MSSTSKLTFVIRALYPGAKVLVGRTVQHSAEHDAAVDQPVSDRNDDRAEGGRVCEPADAARRDQAQALGLVEHFHLWIPDRRIVWKIGICRAAVRRARGVVRHVPVLFACD